MKMSNTGLKTTCVLALLVMLFTSCGHSSYNSKLAQVDSLLTATQYEQADSLLKLCDPSNYNNQDLAYYALLRTQCDYKNYIVATTDSAINLAVDYFSKSSDKEKYTRALIYQGCVNEELGNLEKAVECYHKADDTADKNDLANKAFAKMRLGLLYQNQVVGATTIAINKLKEARDLYNDLKDRHYSLICLTEIARIYSGNKEKSDSALYYIDAAIDSAKKQKDERYTLFANLYTKALFLSNIKHDYKQAKNIALEALSLNDIIDHPRVHFCLAKCYMELGNIDSAKYIIDQAPKIISDIDSISFYDVMSFIEKAQGRYEKYQMYFDKADSMNDSILMNNLNARLREVEKKYDTQKVELENAKLSSKLRGTLLAVAALVIVALVLGLLMMRYRQRLRNKEHEYELLKAELDASLASLRNVHDELGQHERSDKSSEHSEELKGIIDEQIKNVQQLMQWSYELDSDTFFRKFNSLMRMPDEKSDADSSYWSNIHQIANELHDNVLVRAQEATGGTLRNDELNYLALYSCGFTRTVIMLCMGYKSLGTVSNKKLQIAHKLHVQNLDDFLHSGL